MADFAQHLPLSGRRGGDESGVSADRRAAIADLIDEAARLLSGAPAAVDAETAAPEAPDAAETAPAAVDADATAPEATDADAAGAAVRATPDADAARTFLTATGLRLDTDDLAAAAASVRDGRRRRIRDLSRTLRALLVLADARGVPAAVAPPIAGAVALFAATTAPFDRRAVVKGHTVRATDQDWSFGRGPVLAGTADTILRFLLTLSDVPPRRAAATRDPAATVEE